MKSIAVAVWLLVSQGNSFIGVHKYADKQSCETVRNNVRYSDAYKCIQVNVVIAEEMK